MQHETKQGVLIIHLTGNLLSGEAGKTLAGLVKPYLEAGARKVLFNLQEVQFMNSTGIAVLLSASATIGRAGGVVALSKASEQIVNLIQIIRLENVLTIQPDEEAGIAFLNKDK